MSVALQFKLTQTGQAAVWNADKTGISLNLTHIQFGSGNRAPSGTETALLTPQQAVAIAAGFSVSSTQIRMSAIFRGNQNYVVREVGLWAGDPAVGGSKLVGYWSQAAGDLAMKSPGVDFIFSHDMTLDAAVPAGSLTILADNAQSAMLAMITAHEAAANPHNQYATKAAMQAQTYTAFTTAGAAPTFTLAANPAIAAYAAGQRFRVKFGATGNGADTLNVNALGAKSLKQYDATGAKVAAVIAGNQLVDVEYDGVDFILLGPLLTSTGATPGQFDSSTKLATTNFVRGVGVQAGGMTGYSQAQVLTAADIGKFIYLGGFGNYTVTLPLSTALPAGSAILFFANPAGVSIACQGADRWQIAGGAPQAITCQSGDSLIAVTGANGGWYMLGGSVQLPFSQSFGASKAGSGYQKLPSGLIIQWVGGKSFATSGSQVSDTTLLPIAFPNARLGTFPTSYQNGNLTSGDLISVTDTGTNLTQTTVRAVNSVAGSTGYGYIAIGY